MARNPGGRPGRPSRGPRHTFHVLLPKEHHLLYVAESERRGMGALSDYICARLADLHGLEVPGYIQATLPALAVLPGWEQPELVNSVTFGKKVCVRVPVEHHLLYEQRAHAEGLSLSEYARDCLAQIHGLGSGPVHRAEGDLLSA